MDSDYKKLISKESLLQAWRNFLSGKTNKKDAIDFWRNLEDNLFELHHDLRENNYQHGKYEKFIIRDPKRREIHKANVRDRITHQLIFSYLRPIFEKRFIFDSYASRVAKGTYRAVQRLRSFCKRENSRGRQGCWILKCDIEKFFDSIDHQILFSIIRKQVKTPDILGLIYKVIKSFEIKPNKGLPLGNLTSQLFANIYLHEQDYFIKHTLHLKYYIRFNDDFVIVHKDKNFLESQIFLIQKFLSQKLLLSLPQNKIFLRNFFWGIDFLGYIVLPNGILLRAKTRKRMLNKIKIKRNNYKGGEFHFHKLCQTISSYFGILKHCSSFRLRQKILSLVGDKVS